MESVRAERSHHGAWAPVWRLDARLSSWHGLRYRRMNAVTKRRCAVSAAVPAATLSTPVAKFDSSRAPSAGSASMAWGLKTTKSVAELLAERAYGALRDRIGDEDDLVRAVERD